MTTDDPKVGKSAGNRGMGRKKGVPNKTTALLKDAILLAAENAGGDEIGDKPGGLVGYLTTQATANPTAFMALRGKVMPTQLTGDPDNPLAVSGIAVTFVQANASES